MRDFRNIQRRIEFSLERRQLVSLAIGFSIGCVALFLTGYFIGRMNTPDDNARLVKQAATEPAPIPPEAQAASSGSVYKNLTGQQRPLDPLLAEAISKTAPPPSPPEKREAKRIEPSRNQPTPDQPKRRKRKTARVDTGNNTPGGEFKEEIIPFGHYTVQLSAYQDLAEARAFADGIQQRGLTPRIVRADLADRGTWYRIRVGDFPSELEANMYKARIGSLGIQAWVVRNQ